jgi:hypothetical protein
MRNSFSNNFALLSVVVNTEMMPLINILYFKQLAKYELDDTANIALIQCSSTIMEHQLTTQCGCVKHYSEAILAAGFMFDIYRKQ